MIRLIIRRIISGFGLPCRRYLFVLSIVVLFPTSLFAENLRVQIECGNPPHTEETEFEAELEGFSYEGAQLEAGLNIPTKGKVIALRVAGQAYPVTGSVIKNGFFSVEQLGRVFVSIVEEVPGYQVVMLPEQVEFIRDNSLGKK